MLQNLIVGVIVLGAALYASWTLMPGKLRQSLARRLLVVAPQSTWLQNAARVKGGCGSSVCHCSDGGPAPKKTVQVYRRVDQ
jgi:hypothetical protein